MIKNRNENEVVSDKCKNKEFDFDNFKYNVTPNPHIGKNSNEVRLGWKNIGS